MSSDLQASVTSALGPALVALDKVNARMNLLERETRKANRALADYQRTAAKTVNFGTAGQSIGKVAGRIGPGGSVVGKALGGLGMDGAFGRVAAVVGVAGLALRAFTSVMDMTLNRVKQATESQKEYNKAIEAGQNVMKAQVKSGLEGADMRRSLLAAGGQAAVDEANALGQRGDMSQDDANSITQKAFARHGDTDRARNAIKSVTNLVRAGMTPTEASGVIDSRGALDNAESARFAESRIYDKETGRRGSYAAAQNNLAPRNRDTKGNLYPGGAMGDPLLAAQTNSRKILNRIPGIEADRAAKDGGNSSRADLAKASDPVQAAILELQNSRQEQAAVMQRIAAAENAFSAALKNFGMLMGGEGSETQKLRRQQVANGSDSSRVGQELGDR